MERVFYEYKPWIFLMIALIALMTSAPKSSLLYGSSIILVVCSLVILHARYSNRRIRNPFQR